MRVQTRRASSIPGSGPRCVACLVAASWLLATLSIAGAQPNPARTNGGQEVRASEPDATDTREIDSCKNTRVGNHESEAYEHYERGRKLYEQGDYEAAIDEFVRAYCHLPSPSVLKDIAQAFERLVQYEKAVAYLDRYIRENPEGAREERQVQSARVQVLRRLPARLRIATDPPGASVTLTSSLGVRRAGFSNTKDPLKVPSGSYTMTVAMAGYEPVRETIDVQIGQPYSFYYQLEPKKGTLRVVTVPATARIFVDKRWVSLGNYVEQLPVGRYEVSAEADGRLPETREVEIIAGGHRNLSLELEKKPRSGRAELLVSAGVGGLIFGASTLATTISDDELIGSLGGLLGFGISFGGAYVGVPRDIPVGHSSYIIGTSLIGMAQAGLVASFFSCDSAEQEDGSFNRVGCESSLIFGSTLAGGAAGLLFSSLTAGQFDLDAGDAAIINSGATWGSISGALLWSVFNNDVRLDEPLIFGGLNIGLVASALLARRYRVSRGHVALIDLSGLLGLVVAASFVDVADQDSGFSERVPHAALLGMTVGLLTGAYFTRHMDEPKSLSLVSPTVQPAKDAGGNTLLTIGLNGKF